MTRPKPRFSAIRLGRPHALLTLVLLCAVAFAAFARQAHGTVLRPLDIEAGAIDVTVDGQQLTFYDGPQGALSMAVGPKGDIWYPGDPTFQQSRINRLSPAGHGHFITYHVIQHVAGIGPITRGPDGNMWFVATTGQFVGKIDGAGRSVIYHLHTGKYGLFSGGIVAGPDGRLWFTVEQPYPAIAAITTSGSVTFYRVNAIGNPSGITVGPDRNLWFAGSHGVGKSTTAGVLTEYQLNSGAVAGYGIAAGADGNIWFCGTQASYFTLIGRVSTSGTNLTTFAIPGGFMCGNLAAAADGNLYFGALAYTPERPGIGKVTMAGVVTVVTLPARLYHRAAGAVAIAVDAKSAWTVPIYNSGLLARLWFSQ